MCRSPQVTCIQGQTRLAQAVPMAAEDIAHVLILREVRGDAAAAAAGAPPAPAVASRATWVERAPVRKAVEGLCFGFPAGGFESRQAAIDQYATYDPTLAAEPGAEWHDRLEAFRGPDHVDYGRVIYEARVRDRDDAPLHRRQTCIGRWYLLECAPNIFWATTPYSQGNLHAVPVQAGPLEGLVLLRAIRETAPLDEEPDLGPAPEQLGAEDGLDEDEVINNVVLSTLDPADHEAALLKALRERYKDDAAGLQRALASGSIAAGVQARTEGEPLRELRTRGFFTMAFPHIFVNGSCDITIKDNKVNVPTLDEATEHIYFDDDGRVAGDEFLGSVLLALRQRQATLSQGGFMVRQQLAERDASMDALLRALEANDQSVPRMIISRSALLRDSDAYWRRKKAFVRALRSLPLSQRRTACCAPLPVCSAPSLCCAPMEPPPLADPPPR